VKFARDHRGERLLNVDITAMIDVVFLLIIFFMTTAQFAKLTRAQVQLPKEKGTEEQTEKAPAIVINVTKTGDIIVAGANVSPLALTSMLSVEVERATKAGERVQVLIRADLDAPAAHINAIAEDLARLGVRSWRLATSPVGPAGGPQ